MSAEISLTIVDRFRALRETRFGSFVPVLLALIAIWAYFGITEPVFLSPRNFYNLFMQSAVVGTLAVGITMVLLLGDIDLSAAANSGVCAAIVAVLIANFGFSGPVACLVAILAGIVLSAGQGALVAYVGIPSFVVTLAGLLGFQGLMLKVLGQHGAINVSDEFVRGLTKITFSPELGWAIAVAAIAAFTFFTLRRQSRRRSASLELESPGALYGQIVFFSALLVGAVATLNAYRGVPLLVVLLVALTGLLGWVTTSTPFGRSIFAVGGNQESARRVGMNVKRIRVAAFGIVGMMAAVGGIVGASRYASVSFNAFAGGPLLLEAIGAAVIGGTSLFGGRGSVWNAILGALVIGSLGNGLDLSGASAADKLMFSGAILLLAVAIDAISRSGSGQSR
ncbi:MAG: ABC transporter permease [Alphaproteobacteria bacterium]|nr:ABC transporter permease [Alphaproteobacteria bacterium]